MRSAPQKHVTIQSPRLNQQAIAICLRNDRMPMRESYSETSMLDDLVNWQAGGFDVEVAFDDLDIWRNATQKLVGFFIGQVPKTQDLADLAWS
jgi:hypothetical protein